MKYTHTQTNIHKENEYPKLVRDKIPQIIKKRDGIDIDMDCVKNSNRHSYYLLKKIVEEATELSETKTREHLVEEIVDVLEVIDAICSIEVIDKADINRIADEKRSERGGFLGGLVMNKNI